MELALVDWISLGLIGAFGISGLFAGFTKEIFSAGAWLISLFSSWYFGPKLIPHLQNYLENPYLQKITAFLFVFLIVFFFVKLIGSLISRALSFAGLGLIDKMLGLLFGSAKTAAILASFFIWNINFLESQNWWVKSYSRSITIQLTVYSDTLFKDWDLELENLFNKNNINL
jgi:membrane protein required for colicin V production|tara:strand:- start:147 stop:662 length:516 start_codon:yes stop_codon:yes gene_type:complete